MLQRCQAVSMRSLHRKLFHITPDRKSLGRGYGKRDAKVAAQGVGAVFVG
jgi:hypothetical protein